VAVRIPNTDSMKGRLPLTITAVATPFRRPAPTAGSTSSVPAENSQVEIPASAA
jgi:hypothetical protein